MSAENRAFQTSFLGPQIHNMENAIVFKLPEDKTPTPSLPKSIKKQTGRKTLQRSHNAVILPANALYSELMNP
jgi:hypothetical protein